MNTVQEVIAAGDEEIFKNSSKSNIVEKVIASANAAGAEEIFKNPGEMSAELAGKLKKIIACLLPIFPESCSVYEVERKKFYFVIDRMEFFILSQNEKLYIVYYTKIGEVKQHLIDIKVIIDIMCQYCDCYRESLKSK